MFTNKIDALNELKNHKDARFKSFKSKSDAFKFAHNGFVNISVVEAASSLKCMNFKLFNFVVLFSVGCDVVFFGIVVMIVL